MNILYLRAEKSVDDLPNTLVKLGHQVDIFEEACFDVKDASEETIDKVRKKIRGKSYDCAVSYLYFGQISNLCLEFGLRYLCWVYDSPFVNLFDESVKNDNNYFFIFDKKEAERLKDSGASNVYHLPLGVNTDKVAKLMIYEDDVEKYSSDISFVGRLYEKNMYNDLIGYLSPEEQMILKLTLMKELCNWKEGKTWPRITDSLFKMLDENKLVNWKEIGNFDPKTYMGITIISRKLAEMDRLTVLNALSEHFKVDFYTDSESNYLQNINVHPGVDYDVTMNKIFHLSKINLNITLPSIESGLPQRIFDIMGCGGFCFTNKQPEAQELFKVGKEIETFDCLEEMLEKASFYLSHERERLKIAMAGYQKVVKAYKIDDQVRKMLKVL